MNTENNPNPMNLEELFASPATTVPEPSPAAEPQFSPVSEPAAPKPDNIVDLFGAVVEQSEEDTLAELLVKVTTSRPVFDYASIQDEIKDADMTFEQLRVKMSADCPELEARAHVSWSLSYAGFSERITDVNSTIYDAKSKMEQSKKFKDALKKRKPADKLPVCSVKPTVTAQKKGILPCIQGSLRKRGCGRKSERAYLLYPIAERADLRNAPQRDRYVYRAVLENRGAGHGTGRVPDEPAPASSRQARGDHFVLPPCLCVA